MIMKTDSCNCGRKGCLEQYASATGLVRLTKRYFEKNTKNSILNKKEITAKEVFDAAKAGDEAALEITEEFGAYLGQALVKFRLQQLTRQCLLSVEAYQELDRSFRCGQCTF